MSPPRRLIFFLFLFVFTLGASIASVGAERSLAAPPAPSRPVGSPTPTPIRSTAPAARPSGPGLQQLPPRPPSPLNVGQAHLFLTRAAADRLQATSPKNSTENMTYHNGPVEQNSVTYAIFWLPQGVHFEAAQTSTSDQNYETLLLRYFQDVGSSPLYNILTQYSGQSSAPTLNNSSLGGSYVDTTAYPHAGTTSDPLLDGDVQTAVNRAMSANGWSSAPNHEFFVYTGYNVFSCVKADLSFCSFPTSSSGGYCAYHSAIGSPQNYTLYANMGNAATPDPLIGTSDCLDRDHGSGGGPYSPNGDQAADAEISVTSHEHLETVSDPIAYTDPGTGKAIGGWFDSDGGTGEIGDKCAYYFGTIAGNSANVVLDGNPYVVQQEWSNAAGTGAALSGCQLAYTTVTSLSPAVGDVSGGTAVVITGTGFNPGAGGTSVAFGTQPASGTSCMPTSCTATSPAGTGAVAVKVAVDGYTSAATNGDLFNYTLGGAWTEQYPASSPSARTGASMAYDEATKQLILFGGLPDCCTPVADTWSWDASGWTQLNVSGPPPAQYEDYAGMAYDAANQTIVLFRGDGSTWIWDGAAWSAACGTNGTSPCGPPSCGTQGQPVCLTPPAGTVREAVSMAYDPGTQEVLLFGGSVGPGNGFPNPAGDMWAWNGSAWSPACGTPGTPTCLLPARYAASMAYDGGQLVLFGGSDVGGSDGGSVLGDTWVWSGGTWSAVCGTATTSACGPSARAAASMALDGSNGTVVLFGGSSGGTSWLGDTWLWNGKGWVRQCYRCIPFASAPGPREGMAMQYDVALSGMTLFGGYGNDLALSSGPSGSNWLGDTWTWDDLGSPLPAITSITPNSGTAGGGTTVTVTGTHFDVSYGGTSVSFGPNLAPSVYCTNGGYCWNANCASNTSCTAVSPAGSGAVDVVATTSRGSSTTSSVDQFTYGPTVSGVSPAAGAAGGGTPVTISGTGFSMMAGATAVTFGGGAATGVTCGSATQCAVTSPPGVGSVDVSVTVAGLASPLGVIDRFGYIPSITSISPASGPATGGTPVTITGIALSASAGTTTVAFGPNAASSVSCSSATQCTATSPVGDGTVDVVVSTPGGASPPVAGDVFTYLLPAVTGLNPTSGTSLGGTAVTISGSNFSTLAGATTVNFVPSGGTPAPSNLAFSVSCVSTTECTATSPAGSGSVDVEVTVGSGTSAAGGADLFAYVPPPAVTGVSPASGVATGGTTVTITGSAFTGASAVAFGAAPSTGFTVNSDSQITATSPAGVNTVDLTITTAIGTSPPSGSDQFGYVPSVTAVNPASGPAGGNTIVALTGTGFDTAPGATTINFGPNTATNVTCSSHTACSATSPAFQAGAALDVFVMVGGQQSAMTPADLFTYDGGMGTVSASASTLAADRTSVPDDGTTPAALTVTLKDANGNLVSGTAVSLSQPSSSHSTITPASVSTVNGVAAFSVKDATTEAVTYTATDTSDNPAVVLTQTATVSFTPVAVSQTNPQVGSSVTVMVTVSSPSSSATTEHAAGRGLSGQTVTLTANAGSQATITPSQGTTDQNGQASFQLTDNATQGLVLTAVDATTNQTLGVTAMVFGTLPRGDVNGDDQVTSVDALCVLRLVAALPGTSACPQPLPGNPDVNGDGHVTSVDALCALRLVATLPATLACSPPGSNAAHAVTSAAASAAAGPTPSSSSPPSFPGKGAGGLGDAVLGLSLPPLLRGGGPGATSTIAVQVNAGDAGLGAWTVDVHYDPKLATLTACRAGDGAICNLSYAVGVVRITGASAGGVRGRQTLATLSVESLAHGKASSALTLVPVTLTAPDGVPLAAK